VQDNKITMSVLSDSDILTEQKNGNVIISPFNESQVNNSSYDVTLGEFFYCEQGSNETTRAFNPYSEESVNSTWKSQYETYYCDLNKEFDCYQAITKKQILQDSKDKHTFNLDGISDDEKVILIAPGENMLCHTNEFIGGRNNITTMMKAKSSMGRSFIECCSDSGWGDVGYTNRWTMEIRNNSEYHTIVLVVGRPIAQIVFLRTGDVTNSYEKKGSYQKDSNLKDLIQNWKPTDMLPKLYAKK